MEHVRIQDFCWSFRKATKYRETWREHFFVVIWNGRSCQEMCGTILWVGEQNDSTTLQSIHSMPWRPSQKKNNNHQYAVVVRDLAKLCGYIPTRVKLKTSQETQKRLMKFLEPTRKPKVIYTDNSLEFGTSCEDLSWNHCTSTCHIRSETNGIAERAVCRVKEGTSAVLLQSGLNESWWADSMECYTYLRNVTDLFSDGKTPCERRFGQPLKGPIIPFGSSVEYHPISAKDQSRIRQFGKKVLPGLFLGYALYAVRIWKGDVLVADLEELETMDASEIHTNRLNAKEVIFPKQGEFIFPIADGRIKTPGGDQDLRTSTLVRHRPIQGESNIDFLGESEGSLPPPHDSFPDAGEAINDFWSMSGSFIYRHHVEPRVQLYSPREESFPIPLKYIDVTRTTHANLDVKQETRIDDYWNIDGSRDLSDPWTGFTQFTLLDEKAPDGYTWSGERLTRKQLTSRPDHLWQNQKGLFHHLMTRFRMLVKSPIGILKSFTLTILWNSASLVKIFPGIIVRQHHTDRKRMVLLREPYVEWKEGHLRCYCSPVWVTNGGQILWNVTASCETCKTFCLMGRHHMKVGSECHSTDQ